MLRRDDGNEPGRARDGLREERRTAGPMGAFLAIIGGCLIMSIVGFGALAFWVLPGMGLSREPGATRASCASNLRQLGMGVMMYAQDYDDRYPLANSWQGGVMPYVRNTQVFVCPDRGMPNSYAYNSILNGLRAKALTTPSATPMLFDSGLGINNGSDRLQSFLPVHSGFGNVAFADGHVASAAAAPAAAAGVRKPAKPVKRRRR